MVNKNLTKVFINNRGKLNTLGRGKLATLEDLENELCASGQIYEKILQLADGVFIWQSADQQRKILEMDEDIEPWELEECEDGYIKVNSDVSKVYKEFLNNYFDEEISEVVKISFNDNLLFAVTTMLNSPYYYSYNLWIDINGKLQSNCSMIPKDFDLNTNKAITQSYNQINRLYCFK